MIIPEIFLSDEGGQRLALAASGRDADPARKRHPAEALKTAKNRAESHLSAARCVGQCDDEVHLKKLFSSIKSLINAQL